MEPYSLETYFIRATSWITKTTYIKSSKPGPMAEMFFSPFIREERISVCYQLMTNTISVLCADGWPQRKVFTAVLPQSLFPQKVETQMLWPTEHTISSLKFAPLVLAFGLSYHPSITPGKDSDSTVKTFLHSAHDPESGVQLLFKIATLPLKSAATELMTRLLGVLPQLCLRLLISKQVINSLVTSGFLRHYCFRHL